MPGFFIPIAFNYLKVCYLKYVQYVIDIKLFTFGKIMIAFILILPILLYFLSQVRNPIFFDQYRFSQSYQNWFRQDLYRPIPPFLCNSLILIV